MATNEIGISGHECRKRYQAAICRQRVQKLSQMCFLYTAPSGLVIETRVTLVLSLNKDFHLLKLRWHLQSSLVITFGHDILHHCSRRSNDDWTEGAEREDDSYFSASSDITGLDTGHSCLGKLFIPRSPLWRNMPSVSHEYMFTVITFSSFERIWTLYYKMTNRGYCSDREAIYWRSKEYMGGHSYTGFVAIWYGFRYKIKSSRLTYMYLQHICISCDVSVIRIVSISPSYIYNCSMIIVMSLYFVLQQNLMIMRV